MSFLKHCDDTPQAISIKHRLRNKANEQNRLFNDLLQQYVIERFLYRLSISEYRGIFVLKGALMFVALEMSTMRPTRDIDLLGYTANSPDNISRIFREICVCRVENDDGVYFDPDSIKVVDITKGAAYTGKQVKLKACLGKARIPLQVDIGFGDVLASAPQEMVFPALLPRLPAPRIRGYPVEAIIAEKVEVMLRYGTINTRMKDFYDVWMLTKEIGICEGALKQALRATFRHRGTRIPRDVPVAWTSAFAKEKARAWQAFLKRSRLQAPSLEEVAQQLQSTLWPCLQSIAEIQT